MLDGFLGTHFVTRTNRTNSKLEQRLVYPCQRLTYLGIEIDSKLRQLRSPDHKWQEIQAQLGQTLVKSKFTKRELQ